MNNKEKRRKICDSWYHRRWFRIVLIIVGVDIFIFGFLLAAGLDVFLFVSEMVLIVRIIAGFLYILVASFVIHYAVDYEKFLNSSHFTCHHCCHVKKEGDSGIIKPEELIGSNNQLGIKLETKKED